MEEASLGVDDLDDTVTKLTLMLFPLRASGIFFKALPKETPKLSINRLPKSFLFFSTPKVSNLIEFGDFRSLTAALSSFNLNSIKSIKLS